MPSPRIVLGIPLVLCLAAIGCGGEASGAAASSAPQDFPAFAEAYVAHLREHVVAEVEGNAGVWDVIQWGEPSFRLQPMEGGGTLGLVEVHTERLDDRFEYGIGVEFAFTLLPGEPPDLASVKTWGTRTVARETGSPQQVFPQKIEMLKHKWRTDVYSAESLAYAAAARAVGGTCRKVEEDVAAGG